MKIQNVNTLQMDHIARNEVEIVSSGSDEILFQRSLTQESEAAYMKRINQIVGDITRQGEIVAKRADMGELQKYRGMVTALINETVSNGYAFKKSGGMNSRGRSKVFAVIKKINDKLDQMTKKVLDEQKDNINLLDDVDDIRGLLVDMYM